MKCQFNATKIQSCHAGVIRMEYVGCDTDDTRGFDTDKCCSPLRIIWALAIFILLIRLSRYAVRVWNSCLYRLCKNVFSSKYMLTCCKLYTDKNNIDELAHHSLNITCVIGFLDLRVHTHDSFFTFFTFFFFYFFYFL